MSSIDRIFETFVGTVNARKLRDCSRNYSSSMTVVNHVYVKVVAAVLTYWPKTEYRCITRCTRGRVKTLNRSGKETRTHSWWEGQRFIGSHVPSSWNKVRAGYNPFIHSRRECFRRTGRNISLR